MIEDNKHNVTEELLFRYLSEEVSIHERNTVIQWRAENNKNQQAFDDAYVFHLDMKAVGSLKIADQRSSSEDAWDKFTDTNQIDSTSKVIKLAIPKTTLKYAASVLVLIVAGWFYFSNEIDPQLTTIAAHEAAIPIQLADGSTVTINKSSSLSYPEKFNTEQRVVQLIGEAYFDVTPSSSRPFVIEMEDANVTVIGTAFNIKSSPESITLSVDEGKVSLSSFGKNIFVSAGQSIVVDLNTHQFSKLITYNSNEHNFWRTKSLRFNNTKLIDAVQSINSAYKSQISLESENIENCRISVSFEDEDLDNILQIVSSTLGLEVSDINNQIILKGNGCD
ncbi:MAG: FecR domain-containing protein [Reichenbachiella sp.]